MVFSCHCVNNKAANDKLKIDRDRVIEIGKLKENTFNMREKNMEILFLWIVQTNSMWNEWKLLLNYYKIKKKICEKKHTRCTLHKYERTTKWEVDWNIICTQKINLWCSIWLYCNFSIVELLQSKNRRSHFKSC